MASQVTNYQCPACTGPLHFAPGSGKLECDYCGSIFELAEIEALYAQKNEAAAQAKESGEVKTDKSGEWIEDVGEDSGSWDTSDMSDWGADGEGMKAYNCPSCTAQLVCDASTAATSCPYCGNPTVVPGQFTGMLKPDYIIPFKITKEQAVQALKEHYKGKFFLPKAFTDNNHIREIKGIYVPFWMFDGKAVGNATYDAQRMISYRRGDYRITETDFYAVHRSGSLSFEKVPVDASSKMKDDYMESIEPFDYSKLEPFSASYLPGFLADRYDVSVEDSKERADKRCRASMIAAMRGTVHGYTSVFTRSTNVALERGKVHYALLPVWLLSTQWKGQNFLFAINGQTGKKVGDLPVDKGKYWATFAAVAGAVGVVGTAIALLMV